MVRFTSWHRIAGSLALCAALASCNLRDDLADVGPPSSGCEDDSDCNDHGTCEIVDGEGTCVCIRGYRGSTCDRCANGYEPAPGGLCLLPATNNTNSNTTPNNTTPDCDEGQVLLGDACVQDGCATNPCGEGTCTVTGDNAWECDCPNGTTGTECPTCLAGCVNGTCEADDQCVCDRGWGGVACDTCAPGWVGVACNECAPNAFGPNCDTCASLTAAEAWWDPGYQSRRPLVVFNTEATQILDGATVRYSFDHGQLVAMGADRAGGDIRVVHAGVELDRLLGFDSGWALPGTQIWFATQASLDANAFDLYFVYARNTMAAAPLEDAAAVLRQDRGWYHYNGAPIYSPAPLSTGEYSIQVRQKDPTTMEVYFRDAGDDLSAAAELRFVNAQTGATAATLTFGANTGSSAMPGADVRELTIGTQPGELPSNLRLDATISPGGLGTDTAALYLGAQLVTFGTQTLTQQSTLVRAANVPASPSIYECPVETP